MGGVKAGVSLLSQPAGLPTLASSLLQIDSDEEVSEDARRTALDSVSAELQPAMLDRELGLSLVAMYGYVCIECLRLSGGEDDRYSAWWKATWKQAQTNKLFKYFAELRNEFAKQGGLEGQLEFSFGWLRFEDENRVPASDPMWHFTLRVPKFETHYLQQSSLASVELLEGDKLSAANVAHEYLLRLSDMVESVFNWHGVSLDEIRTLPTGFLSYGL